jgi:hypothetical protein
MRKIAEVLMTIPDAVLGRVRKTSIILFDRGARRVRGVRLGAAMSLTIERSLYSTFSFWKR